MKAILVGEAPDFELCWSDAPTPKPGAGEVRIQVQAAGVNRADLLQRKGLYPSPEGASNILGLECSGIIDAVGAGVDPSRIGERVCALLPGGGYAESTICAESHAITIPPGMSLIDAASLPEAWATVWLNLVVEADLQPGERVIIHAGASGIGTAAIQLCKMLGFPCFVTVGTKEKLELCLKLGAEAGVIRHDGPWINAAKKWSPRGVNAILDPVGGSYLEDNIRSLAPHGRLIVIGLLGGRKATLDLGRVLIKGHRIIGSTLRSRDDRTKNSLLNSLKADVIPRIISGELTLTICERVPIPQADSAHRYLNNNATSGKVVLLVEAKNF